MAQLAEDVAAAADEVGGVENRLVLRDDVIALFPAAVLA